MEGAMTAANIVRFRTKPGRQQDFIDAHRNATLDVPGFRRGVLVQTGDRTFCFFGEWDSMSELSGGRQQMISILDSFRDTLEDLGGDLGVTDPVSGEVVVEVS
jgi:quinol monooxygenase YgiN